VAFIAVPVALAIPDVLAVAFIAVPVALAIPDVLEVADGTVCALAKKFESTTIVVTVNNSDKYPLPIITF